MIYEMEEIRDDSESAACPAPSPTSYESETERDSDSDLARYATGSAARVVRKSHKNDRRQKGSMLIDSSSEDDVEIIEKPMKSLKSTKGRRGQAPLANRRGGQVAVPIDVSDAEEAGGN